MAPFWLLILISVVVAGDRDVPAHAAPQQEERPGPDPRPRLPHPGRAHPDRAAPAGQPRTGHHRPPRPQPSRRRRPPQVALRPPLHEEQRDAAVEAVLQVEVGSGTGRQRWTQTATHQV